VLLTFGDAETGRIRFHATSRAMIERQVEATVAGRGLGVYTSWERMPAELEERLAGLRRDGYAGVVLGDVHLADVRAWYEERVVAAGLEHVEPLWGDDPMALVEEFVATGGRAVVTCVDTERLDAAWLGRVVDEAFVREIAATPVDPCGENGEYHSFAFAGPAFARPVAWRPGERRSDGRFVQLDVLPA
jgi:diphthamide synthase (EF-2-diphthine--ammonia ligase)